MKLLGAYPSGLVAKHYDQLLQLLNQSLSVGDYGGGSLVDAAVIAQLQTQAADFTSLPTVSAGDRATADQITYMLNLLRARYNALDQERQEFLSKMDRFLTLLESDSGLIDQLLAEGNLKLWVSRQGPLSGAVQFSQDFAATHGPTDATLPLTDPSSGVLYTAAVQDVALMLNPVSGLEAEPVRFGIGVPGNQVQFKPVTISWGFPSGALEVDNQVGTDWAQLSLLEPAPMLTYGKPAISPLIPADSAAASLFLVEGSDIAGNVPIYVRIVRVERMLSAAVSTQDAGVPIAFSGYPITGDNFIVLDAVRSYDQGIDYIVDAAGRLVPMSTAANKNLTILFSAQFPGYQSSLNQQDWSSLLLFDAIRPYPDGVSGPVQIVNNQFPLLDDQNNPLGLYLTPLQNIDEECLFRIDTPVANSYGVTATLTVQLDKPTYMNGLHLAPFSTYPGHLQSIQAAGLTTDTNTEIWSGDLLLDRPVSVRFDRQLVSQFTLTFYQENYTFQSYVVDPADKIRRDALVSLQAVLPFSFRRINISSSPEISGAQYDLGIKDICGEDNQAVMPQDCGVIVAGPFEVEGTPELIRLDAQYCGGIPGVSGSTNVQFYLLDVPFNSSQVAVSSVMIQDNPNGFLITPGQAISYIPPSTISSTSKVQFYIKMVMRDPYAVIERFLLQVTRI